MSHDEAITASPEETVTAAYRALLRRDPDPEGLRNCVEAIRGGRNLDWLLESLIGSEEFKLVHFANYLPLDTAPPMNVQVDFANLNERRAFWDHIASIWSNFGELDPYWSVLTDERWRSKNMSDKAALEAFYSTGQAELERMEAWFNRNCLELRGDAVVAEYGCGVGRLTQWLAQRFRRVVAFDISEPHLEAARKRLSERGAANVDFVLVRKKADLKALSGIDLFYSMIVLQHNPPPMMVEILSSVFTALRAGGHCFFQVPTYARDYSFNVDSYWKDLADKKQMEMHFLPQKIVLELAQKSRVFPVEVQPDKCIGNPNNWISNTFLMTKAASLSHRIKTWCLRRN
jgi:SAM-dependent methyltransferase